MFKTKDDDIKLMTDTYSAYVNSYESLKSSIRTRIDEKLWKKNGLCYNIIPFQSERNGSGRYIAGKHKKIEPIDKTGYTVEYLCEKRVTCSERFVNNSFADPITFFIRNDLCLRFHYWNDGFILDTISKIDVSNDCVTSALAYIVEPSSNNPPFRKQQITRYDYSYKNGLINSFDVRVYVKNNISKDWSESITAYQVTYEDNIPSSLNWNTGDRCGIVRIK